MSLHFCGPLPDFPTFSILFLSLLPFFCYCRVIMLFTSNSILVLKSSFLQTDDTFPLCSLLIMNPLTSSSYSDSNNTIINCLIIIQYLSGFSTSLLFMQFIRSFSACCWPQTCSFINIFHHFTPCFAFPINFI